ncbi:MAG TPA: adenylosuccinate synthase, partial [Bacteroidetes bacterium]|nr:adenylosuccinate synthase [Bacteroidota bacterium]HEX05471.1 adenylosuccinate synthase [Bacteroidota bacterium]
HPNVICLLGSGSVIDPRILFEEIEQLESRGVKVKGRLFISHKAHLIMPYHRAIDEAAEHAAGKSRIGTTGRGIGPAYTDKYQRCGIRIVDLLDRDHLEKKLRANLADKNKLLRDYYKSSELDVNRIVDEYIDFDRKADPYIKDVSVFLDDAIAEGKNVLLEGAQGTLLDVDHGTYPFVTSSNPSAGAAATGLGIGPRRITHVVGVLKAYTTRVGNGPFPTELDEPLQSQFRKWGGEYGATTGRARRCGWLDLVIGRYSARINGLDSWAITKLDVLSQLDEIHVCTSYKYKGREVRHFPAEPWVLDEVQPVYETLPGWKEDISDVRHYDDLPASCRSYLDFIKDQTGVPIGLISVGAERGAYIPLSDEVLGLA